MSDNALLGPRTKIERAKKHIQDLDVALKAFFDANPYKVGTKPNPETRQLVYYLTAVEDPPLIIAGIIGDIIQNLRSALDHLAYQLVVLGTGKPGPFTYVYFPIFDSPEEYEAKKLRQIKGMRPETIKAIDAVKPYKGGNDSLWRLHQLNRVDKHRLLITVGSYFRSFDIGALMNQQMREVFPDSFKIPSLFLKPADRMYPLKAGDVLFIDKTNAKVNEDMYFRFEVALSEPQVIESEPILPTLQQLIDLVDSIINIFDSHATTPCK